MIVPRIPSIRPTTFNVTPERDRVGNAGSVSVPSIEPREHAAWMQQIGDLLSTNSAQITGLQAKDVVLDGRVTTLESVVSGLASSESAASVNAALQTHVGDHANPHAVTASQVGADPAGTGAGAAASALATASSLVAAEATARMAGDAANSGGLTTHAGLTEAHGGTGAVMGTTNTQDVSNKTLDSTNKFGGSSNYTSFESDGTMVATGDATTYDDSQAAVIYMRVGGTALVQDVLAGTIYQYRFDKGDEVYSQIQLSHRYKANSPIHVHIHLINKAAVGATSYNVGIQVEWMWGSINSVVPAPQTTSVVDCSFQNASALTHKVFEIATLTPTTGQGSISSILFLRIARVAGSTQDLAGNNIFIAGFDVHTLQDTLGSRTEYSK